MVPRDVFRILYDQGDFSLNITKIIETFHHKTNIALHNNRQKKGIITFHHLQPDSTKTTHSPRSSYHYVLYIS